MLETLESPNTPIRKRGRSAHGHASLHKLASKLGKRGNRKGVSPRSLERMLTGLPNPAWERDRLVLISNLAPLLRTTPEFIRDVLSSKDRALTAQETSE